MIRTIKVFIALLRSCDATENKPDLVSAKSCLFDRGSVTITLPSRTTLTGQTAVNKIIIKYLHTTWNSLYR